ncbi:hypothetical protein T484DRAFT_1882906, partial [Baffinella frigidus]
MAGRSAVSREPLVTPRTPAAAAALREEERRVANSSKELLASDRLASLAGRENMLHQEAQRTGEALSWLDRRFEADLRASRDAPRSGDAAAGGNLYGEDGEAEEKQLAEADVRREMLRNAPPGKSKTDALKERVAHSHRDSHPSLLDEPLPSAPAGGGGGSALSASAREQLSCIEASHRHEGGSVDGDESAHRSPRRGVDSWAARPHEDERGAVRVLPNSDIWSMSEAGRSSAAPHLANIYKQFLDIWGMSEAGRSSAAPHLANIYKQIFIDDARDFPPVDIFIDDARDLPPADVSAANRASHSGDRYSQELDGPAVDGPAGGSGGDLDGPAVGSAHGDDSSCRVRLVLAQGGAVVAGWAHDPLLNPAGARRSAWERAILTDVAAGIGAAPHRIRILSVSRGARGTWATLGGGEVHVVLRIVPDADPAAASCRELAVRLVTVAED